MSPTLKLKTRQLAELEANAATGDASAIKHLPKLRRQVEALTKADAVEEPDDAPEVDAAAELRAENEKLRAELAAAKAAPALTKAKAKGKR